MTPDSTPPPRRGWLTINLVLQLAFGLLSMTICLPSMQDWPAQFVASQASVQLTFSLYVAAYGGLQLVYGPLSDRLGRKPILMLGLSLALAGSLLAALAPNLMVLVLARALQGAGSAAGMVVGRAMVQDLFHGAERTRMMAYIGIAMGLCPPLATLLGGQLHVWLGWQANFVLMAVMALVLLVSAWRVLPARSATPPQAVGQALGLGKLLDAYARLLREPAFLLYVTILATSTATFYAFLAGAPLVLGGYGVGPAQIGWYIMAIPFPYVVGNVLTSRLIHRIGDSGLMHLGQTSVLCGLGLLLALGLAGWHTPLAFVLPLVLLGLGHGLLAPSVLAGTVGLVPTLAGSAAAVGGLMQQLTGALGGYVVGLLSHNGPVNLGLLMLGLSLCGMAAQWRLHHVSRRRA